jgi:hypothetical protein
MADKETVVVHDNERPVREGSNPAVVIAVVILIALLLLIFLGRGLFGGNNNGGNVPTNVKVQAPSGQ